MTVPKWVKVGALVIEGMLLIGAVYTGVSHQRMTTRRPRTNAPIDTTARTRATIPEGSTARCRDGVYSFSRHHSGSCSRHGGVKVWY